MKSPSMEPDGERKPREIVRLVYAGITILVFLIWGGFLYSAWVRQSRPPAKPAAGIVPASTHFSGETAKPETAAVVKSPAPALTRTPEPDFKESPNAAQASIKPQKSPANQTAAPEPSPSPEEPGTPLPDVETYIREYVFSPSPVERKAIEKPAMSYLLNGIEYPLSPAPSGKRPLVIEEKEQMKEILDRVLTYLESRFDMVFNQPLKVEFVTDREMDQAFEGECKGMEVGFYLRGSDKGRPFHQVYIMKNRSYESVFDTAIHELAHAWQAENVPSGQDMRIIEGFATWIACKGLYDDGDYAMYNSYMDNISGPVYGVGYRYILHLEDSMGEKKVVQFVKSAREMPDF